MNNCHLWILKIYQVDIRNIHYPWYIDGIRKIYAKIYAIVYYVFCTVLPCGESRDCGTTYCKTTGPANLRYHLKNAHGLEAPSYLKELVVLANDNKDLKKKMALTTMFAPSTDSAKTQVEKLALAWCMNLRMSFKLLRDPYFISAFSASIPPGFKESDLTTAIIEYDNKLCERVKELLSNSVASLELDGGKDVNSRKLIGLGVLKDGSAFVGSLRY